MMDKLSPSLMESDTHHMRDILTGLDWAPSATASFILNVSLNSYTNSTETILHNFHKLFDVTSNKLFVM